MIAKPFIDRFKKSGKTAAQPEHDNNKFLRLFQQINQIPSGKSAPEKLAGCIFRTFSPAAIIVSRNNNESLKIEHLWLNSSDTDGTNIRLDNDIIGKPASILCEQVKNSKQRQSTENVTENYPNDPLLQLFSVQTHTSFPVYDEDNLIIAVISLVDKQRKTYSTFELDLLSAVTQRIGRELDHSDSISTPLPDQNDSSDAQLKAELEAANKSLESLSYAISHDLRAPLRSMDSFSLLLVEDYASDLPDEAINYLSRIRRAAKRMGSMIDDLLWLAKVTRRKLEKQEMDLSKTAANILDDIKEKHSGYNCELHTDPHLLVSADKNLMKIALQHLLTNACKFSQHKEKISISLSRYEDNGETIYKISDNGCGFDMAYYEQLFEPFKKLHNGTDYKGTGIGLATVKRIIQRHGGRVWAESELDEGTSVFFTLKPGER